LQLLVCISYKTIIDIRDDDMNTPQDTQMTSNRLADQVAYDPNHLLDSLIEKLHLKNDAALSRALEVAPPVISKIRHRRLPVGASLLIRMHEVSDLSIRDLRILMGDRRDKFRISDKQFKPKEGNGIEMHE
jgi:plasmid maintenance system antidote protein VapI